MTDRRALVAIAVAVSCLLLTAVACRQLRYGVSSFLRSSPDYDRIETERAASSERSRPQGAPRRAPARDANWTQYRGPQGDGVYREQPLDLDWSGSASPRRWSAPVGPAYTSAVIADGLVITMEQRRDREAVVAFGLESGGVVWEHTWPGRFYESMSKEGPRATPAIAGRRVVALGATGEARCLDLRDGELLWRANLLEEEERSNLRYGLAASPRVREDLVIVQGASSVRAFDLATGERRWSALSEPLAYATPVLGRILGVDTAVVTTARRLVGLDVETGEERWSFPWRVSSGLACTQPILVGRDRVFVSAGYGKGSQVVALSRATSSVKAEVVWKSRRMKTRFNEPVLRDGFVYGLDEGILSCVRVDDGEVQWKKGRYGYGQILAVDERILLVDQDNRIHVLEVGPEGPVELGGFAGPEGRSALNLPSLAHGYFVVRSEKEIVCWDLRPLAARVGAGLTPGARR